jgi:hypothetical protein
MPIGMVTTVSARWDMSMLMENARPPRLQSLSPSSSLILEPKLPAPPANPPLARPPLDQPPLDQPPLDPLPLDPLPLDLPQQAQPPLDPLPLAQPPPAQPPLAQLPLVLRPLVLLLVEPTPTTTALVSASAVKVSTNQETTAWQELPAEPTVKGMLMAAASAFLASLTTMEFALNALPEPSGAQPPSSASSSAARMLPTLLQPMLASALQALA